MLERVKARPISLTVLLSTAIGLLIALSVGTVLFITAGANFRNTLELLRNSATLTMSSMETQLRAYVDPAEAVASHVVRLVDEGVIDLSDKERLQGNLAGMLGAAPQVSGVVVWDRDLQRLTVWLDEDGSLKSEAADHSVPAGDAEIMAPTEMPDSPAWTKPVFVEDTTYVNIQTSLYNDGEKVGAFATGIDVADLSDLTRDLGGALDMTVFILYGDDHVLAHPQLKSFASLSGSDPETNLPRIAGFSDPVIAGYPDREIDVDRQGSIDFENSIVEVGERPYLVLSKEITGYGPKPWHIGVYARLSDVDDQFRRLAVSTGVAFAILLVSIVAGLLLARYLARPIVQLSQAAGQVGNLELENIKVPKSSFIREINDQISAFDRMVEGLRTFETYIPRALVRRIMSQGGSGEVVSTESHLTLMFTDIIGFTNMSEHMEPGEVARLLNDHFTDVNECIEAEGGTIDKYIGDAVMAFWGAPDAQLDQSVRACKAALAIRKRMQEANGDSNRERDLRIKISIHCGPLIVGNIGAPGRINYTVVGDTVNTCSRIEDLCDGIDDGSNPAIILVSEEVVAETGDRFAFEPAGSFRVKGKSKALKVFALIGEKAAD